MAAAHRMANSNKWDGWWECSTCGQEFTGAMMLGLAEAWWSTVQRLREEDDEWLAAAGNLANALDDQGMHAKAEALFRKVLSVQRRVLGPEHPTTLSTTCELALTLKIQGRLLKAESMYREVLGIERRVLGPEHPDTLTTITTWLPHSTHKASTPKPRHSAARCLRFSGGC
jgi:tetratricopeptide (TPR) repeat protein